MSALIIKSENYNPDRELEIVEDQRNKGCNAWIEDESGAAVDEQSLKIIGREATESVIDERAKQIARMVTLIVYGLQTKSYDEFIESFSNPGGKPTLSERRKQELHFQMRISSTCWYDAFVEYLPDGTPHFYVKGSGDDWGVLIMGDAVADHRIGVDFIVPTGSQPGRDAHAIMHTLQMVPGWSRSDTELESVAATREALSQYTASRVTAGGPHGVDQDACRAGGLTSGTARLPAAVGRLVFGDSYVAPDDVLQETTKEQYSTPEQLPRANVPPQSRSTWYEHEPHAADPHVEASGVRYDDYEDQSHDHSDDHADSEDWDEDPIPPRRGEFTFVAAVFGLALLGTAVAFAFTPFVDSIVPSLLSIIKAGGPNKIIQTNTAFQGNVSLQADAEKAGSGERLVPSEDRSADVPPPVSTPSQSVSSAPIFADPTPAPEPGLAKPAPAARLESLNNPPTVPVPPIPRADQAAAPEAPTLTPASPADRGPKKTDQPNAAGSVASQPQSVPIRPATREAPSDANGLFNDAATPPAASAPTAPPERPAPVDKPAATKIAPTSPAASGGGYAVQVSSQRNENEVQSSFRTLQAKYPKLLGGREPMVRRADLGAKGIYYRATVGPFVSAQQANELCSNLKAAGGNCIVQKY